MAITGNVLRIQQNLNKLGYTGLDGRPLDEDGVLGDNTRYAIGQYQKNTSAKMLVSMDLGTNGKYIETDGQVAALQELLNQAGYTDMNGNRLAVDGVLGEKTQYALAQQQADQAAKAAARASVVPGGGTPRTEDFAAGAARPAAAGISGVPPAGRSAGRVSGREGESGPDLADQAVNWLNGLFGAPTPAPGLDYASAAAEESDEEIIRGMRDAAQRYVFPPKQRQEEEQKQAGQVSINRAAGQENTVAGANQGEEEGRSFGGDRREAGEDKGAESTNSKHSKQILDGFQLGLDVAGLMPVLGESADAVNALISLICGDYVDAGLSLGSMIPVAGWTASAGKAAKYALEYGDEAVEAGEAIVKGVGRHADDVAQAAGAAKRGKGVAEGVTEGAGDVVGSLDGLTQSERTIIDDIVKQGKQVEIIPRSNVPKVKTPDVKINGVKTEFKTLNGTSLNTPVTKITKGFSQGAEVVIVDARATGLTAEQASVILSRIKGIYEGNIPGKIEIWTKSGIIYGGK